MLFGRTRPSALVRELKYILPPILSGRTRPSALVRDLKSISPPTCWGRTRPSALVRESKSILPGRALNFFGLFSHSFCDKATSSSSILNIRL